MPYIAMNSATTGFQNKFPLFGLLLILKFELDSLLQSVPCFQPREHIRKNE